MRRPRRNTAAFTAKVASAALMSDAATAQLASRFDVHAHQITEWKQQLMAHAAAVFAGEGARADAAPAVDVKALHAKIGAQALEINCLASALGQSRDLSARR